MGKDRLQEIEEYVHNMQIKKTFFGGYDREDVYVKLSEISGMYQTYITDILESQKKQMEDYEQRIHTSEMLVNELNKKLGILSAEQRNRDKEKEELKGTYQTYCKNILQQYSDSLRTLSMEFAQILENVTNLQDNILNLEEMDIFELEQEAAPALQTEEKPGEQTEG